jgi:hypothetical protein
MFKKLLILVSLVFITACGGTKKTVTETKNKVETLTVTETVKLDTTIFIPAEKASLFIPFEKLKLNSSEGSKGFTQKKGRATVHVKVDSSGITATANCDSIAKQLQFYKTKITEMSKLVSEIKAKEEIKKGYNFLQLFLYVTAFSIVSLVAGYLIKTFKII